MELSIKHITLSSGERFKLLVDTTGVPLYYPNLFITSHVRGGAQSVSTVANSLHALKVMYLWLDHYEIDIEARFREGELLQLHEIISLRDFTKKSLKALKQDSKVVSLFAEKGDAWVGGGSQYSRMTVIAEYLKFLAETLTANRSDPGLSHRIGVMIVRIKAHRPKKKNRAAKDPTDKGINEEVLDQLFEVMKPGHPDNPFSDDGVQMRNALMIALLRHLGIRRGELLNLRVDDIDFTNHTLCIVRRPDSVADKRDHQPLVKTRERTLPITEELAQHLTDYVLNYRNKFRKARFHPYLFVTHKSGPSEGRPVSNAGFGKLMGVIKASAEAFSDVHAHAFRHAWNYGFSQSIDEKGNITPEAEEQIRSFLMGWSPTSGTALIYNKRHIKEKSREAMLEYQSKLNKAGRRGENGDD